MRLFKRRRKDGLTDDFDWGLYPRLYAREVTHLERKYTTKLEPGDAALEDGALVLKRKISPLHPNHSTVYETIGLLEPGSCVEVGCGGGDHLHNLRTLYPDMPLRGYDRSEDQLDFLKERSPHLTERVGVMDITMPFSDRWPTADVVFTQAVVMHLKLGNSHLVALSNLVRMARKAVILMENYFQHSFVDDLRKLHREGMLTWDDLHFHFRRYQDRPYVLVIANQKLPFEELGDYHMLLDTFK